MKKIYIVVFTALLISSVDAGKNIQRIVFEEKQIEGKIRRPQLVLIKADQRPDFKPMVMQSLDTSLDVVEFGRSPALDKSPYNGVFLFNNNNSISNYAP